MFISSRPMRVCAAATTALLLQACMHVLSERGIAAPPPSLSKEEAALTEWLTAYNRNIGVEFERFAARRYSPSALAERDPSAIADGARNWHQSFGPMRLVGAPVVKPGEAEAVVYAAGVDAALGWFLCSRGGVETLEHSRSSWGVRTQIALYPSLDIVVVILANSDSTGTQALHYETRKWLSSLSDRSGVAW